MFQSGFIEVASRVNNFSKERKFHLFVKLEVAAFSHFSSRDSSAIPGLD